MKTVVTSSVEEAADFIRRGELAAFPTETVYGLGADALDSTAVGLIYDVKGRPLDNPMIVHLHEISEIRSVVRSVPAHAADLISAFLPGPLTLVLEKADVIPTAVTAGLPTVGVRVPSHVVATRFLEACGRPVAAPSANRSGRPSPTSWQSVIEDLDGTISCVLKGDRSTVGLESTVVDCTSSIPVVLREGAVPLQRLREIVPSTQPSTAAGTRAYRSPGLRHRHYAPHARVYLYGDYPDAATGRRAFIGLSTPDLAETFEIVLVCGDLDNYAHELYHFFRDCDRMGIDTIFCERPPVTGIGSALLDRIVRAGQAAPPGLRT